MARIRTDIPTLSRAVEMFIAECRVARQTHAVIKSKERTLSFLIRVAGGDRTVDGLTETHFLAAMDNLGTGADDTENELRQKKGWTRRTGRSPASLRVDKSTLRLFAERLRRRGWVEPGFFPLDDLLKSSKLEADDLPGRRKSAKRALPETEWGVLLATAEKRHARARMIVAVGLFAGRRVSEICALQWGDIDLERSRYQYRNQKGGRDAWFAFDLSLKVELQRWKAWLETNYGAVQDDWFVIPAKLRVWDVWPDLDLKRECQRNSPELWPVVMDRACGTGPARTEFKKCLRDMGWTGDQLYMEGMHTLRRSHLRAVRNKLGMDAAQQSAGHAQVSTTAGYMDVEEDRERAAELFVDQVVFEAGNVPEEMRPTNHPIPVPRTGDHSDTVIHVDFGRRKAL